jgi:hypothetical protein
LSALDAQLLAPYLDAGPEPRAPGREPRPPDAPRPPAPAPAPRTRIGTIGRFIGGIFNQSSDERSERRYRRELAEYRRRQERYNHLLGEWIRSYDSWRRRLANWRGQQTRKLNAYRSNGARMRVHVEGYFRAQWLPSHRWQLVPPETMRRVIELWTNDAVQAAADMLYEAFLREYKMQNADQWMDDSIVTELLLRPERS